MSVTTERTQQGIPVDARRAAPRDWLGLVVLALAVFLISVDGTVLDLALPFISEDLAPSSTALLWIIDVYSFVLAGLLVTMGTLGDRIGRRRLLLIGAAGFGLASALAAFAVSPEMLIAARALQGVAGATLMPSTLGLIRTMFADRRQRTTAIAVWGAMAGGGAAAGPLVGGWLLEHYWWGSVFLINLPVMLALIVFGPMVIRESRDPNPGRFDIISAALSMLAMIPLVYAVKETVAHGPSRTLAVIAGIGVLAGWAFVRRQRVLDAPMLDLSLFSRPAFTTGVVTNFMSIFAFAGVLFFGSQYLQLVLGYSPLEAGLLMLPGTAMNIVFSLLAAWFVRRWRPGTVLALGLAGTALGAAVLTLLRTDGGPAVFIVGFAFAGAGVGIALTLTSDLVVGAVEPDRAGAASAVSETAYELGVALGVAVLGSVVLALFRSGLNVSGLDEPTAAAARETLGGAVTVAEQAPAGVGAALLDSAQQAFVAGTHLAATITAIVLVLNAILVYRMMRRS